MPEIFLLGITLLFGVAFGAAVFRFTSRQLERERFIRNYVFAQSLLVSIQKPYPHLEEKDCFLAARALREYFLVHLRAKGRAVAMPSKVVDALWHEFILDTKAYHDFCAQAFGAYFHHIPAAKMRPGVSSEDALRRTWRLACLEENIAPRNPTRLPLLFAIDAKLNIPNGNTYQLSAPPKPKDEGGGSGCGGYACSGDGLADGHSGHSGCSGSDGGSSCGGGGCGGGD